MAIDQKDSGMMESRSEINRIIHYGFSSLIAFIGLLVMVGWWIKSPGLIQILPHFVPMQFNTALCFFFLGTALLFLNHYKVISAILAGLVFIIALLTVAQYWGGVDFGIDEFFVKHYILVKTSHSGRMAPNTAACFVLISLSIMSYVSFYKRKYVFDFVLFVALIVGALSLTAFFGYVSNTPTAYGWGKVTSMALHTAISFMLIVVILGNQTWSRCYINQKKEGLFIPILISIFSLFCFMLFTRAISLEQAETTRKTVEYNAEIISNKIAGLLQEDIKAIARIFSRAGSGAYASEEKLKADADSYMSHIAALNLLQIRLPESPHWRIFVSNKKISWIQINNETEKCIKTLTSNKKQGSFEELKMVSYENRLCLFDEKINALAILDIEQMLKPLVSKPFEQIYSMKIRDRSHVIFRYENDSSPEYGSNSEIKLYGLNWTLSVNPNKKFLEQISPWVTWVFFIFGFLLSILLGYLIRYRQLLNIKNKSLQSSEQLFRTVVEGTIDSILIVNSAGDIIFANQRSAKLWHYPLETLFNKKFEELIPEGINKNQKADKKPYTNPFYAGKSATKMSVKILTKQGKEIPVDVSLLRIYINEQDCMLYTVRDISDYVASQEKIKEEIEFINLIYTATNQMIEAEDVDSAIMICLNLICRTLAWPIGHAYLLKDEKIVPSKLWHLDNPEKGLSFKKATMKTIFNKGEGLPGIVQEKGEIIWLSEISEKNFIRSSISKEINIHSGVALPVFVEGKVSFILEFFSYSMQEENTELIQSLSVLANQIGRIVELKIYQKKLEEYSNRLERSNKALDTFAFIASHDLKEPLRGILSFVHFLVEDYYEKIDEAGKKQIDSIKNLANRMQMLIDGLLEYSRVGRIDWAFAKVDLDQVIQEKLVMLQNFLKENKATVKIAKPLPELVCDKIRLGEVFYNLITNGIKYNDRPEKNVLIDYEKKEDKYIFSVKDNGIGIKPKDIEKIFLIFQRLHHKDEYSGGTGIGMTIVKKIIESHHGDIWIESEVGKGTAVYFSISADLPVSEKKEEEED